MEASSLVQNNTTRTAVSVIIPDAPVLCVNARQAALLTTDGEIRVIAHTQVKNIIGSYPVIVCHAPYTFQTIGLDPVPAYDLLELFAFVHPAVFCVPTPVGLCKALGITPPRSFDDYPIVLLECTKSLLSDMRHDKWQAKANPLTISSVMAAQGKGWGWTNFIHLALDKTYDPRIPVIAKQDLNIWKHLPEWSEEAPPPPPTHHGVEIEEIALQLESYLGNTAEKRQEQISYAQSLAPAFSPKSDKNKPHFVLAEAGTGVGKTMGYLTPASLWAEKNQGSVWISTYTKNLQRQVGQELDRIYPNPDVKDNKVAIRKGRENYLCLLNLEEMAAGAALAKDVRQAIAMGLMVRWAAATENGDLISGMDFPGWLYDLLGYSYTLGLADKRGECIFSACDHYHRCFVEQSVRRSAHARIVIGNHALLMIKAAHGDEDLPRRLVFDEGHHIFDAADSAFSGHLTALETYDMRRWLRGAETGGKSRRRGLKSRIEDVLQGDDVALRYMEEIIEQAHHLTAYGWQKRLKDGVPKGIAEEFILQIYHQVYNRNGKDYTGYSLETDSFPIDTALAGLLPSFKQKLEALKKPMLALSLHIHKKLNEQADTLQSDTKKRLDAVRQSLERRANTQLSAWIAMLDTLITQTTDESFVDWMEIERVDGKTYDIGLYRHWVNPMIPFAKAIGPAADGLIITSATLKDRTEDDNKNWQVAKDITGADLITSEPALHSYPSPFDYKSQTRVFILTDVSKNDSDQVAAAYRELFKASGGGAIGLFTAISRLKYVYQKIKLALNDRNIALYAQHIDQMDTGTLVDIFREDEHACLLGTDAIRDGVDVRGDSLRLLVFDRVPWPRPTILHRARQKFFGRQAYDDRLTRLKIKQAFGRLIRQKDDKGVFVILDSAMPSRLHSAFPEGVTIERLSLADTLIKIKDFLGSYETST